LDAGFLPFPKNGMEQENKVNIDMATRLKAARVKEAFLMSFFSETLKKYLSFS